MMVTGGRGVASMIVLDRVAKPIIARYAIRNSRPAPSSPSRTFTSAEPPGQPASISSASYQVRTHDHRELALAAEYDLE